MWKKTASSTALIGFGLDSVIEVSSAAAVAWQFSAREHAVREAREKRTLQIIAVSFFALAAYVTVESVRSLLGAESADHSTVGIVLAAVAGAVAMEDRELAVSDGLLPVQPVATAEVTGEVPVLLDAA